MANKYRFITHQQNPESKVVEKKGPSLSSIIPSASKPPTFRMPQWWPEFVKGEAAFNASGNQLRLPKEMNQPGSHSLYYNSTISPSSDNSIPVSLRGCSTLSTSRPEEHVTQLIDKSPIALSARSALTSELSAIDSQDRSWEVEKILERRIARGQGFRAKRKKPYLVQWAPSWLSIEELCSARKAWKIVKISQDRHSAKGNKIKVTWAPSWVSAVERASTSGSE